MVRRYQRFELEQHQKAKEKDRSKRAKGLIKAREARLRGWAKRHGLEKREAVQQAIESTSSTVTVELTTDEIEELDRSNDGTIHGIELFEEPEDDITQAMVDTSISSSALPYSSTRGNGVGIYIDRVRLC